MLAGGELTTDGAAAIEADLAAEEQAANDLQACPGEPLKWRAVGHERRAMLRKRAICFKTPQPARPANEVEIPKRNKCVGKGNSLTSFSSEQVVAAVQQGARYQNDGAQALQQGCKFLHYCIPYDERTDCITDPHDFTNTPGVDDVTTSSACAGKTILEFPILEGGTVVDVGKNNRNVDAGIHRVLFAMNGANPIYCGLMTHTDGSVPDPNNPGKTLQPFLDCFNPD